MEDEIQNRIFELIKDSYVLCPECENIEDYQYTCTTCWFQGGNGKIFILPILKELKQINK